MGQNKKGRHKLTKNERDQRKKDKPTKIETKREIMQKRRTITRKSLQEWDRMRFNEKEQRASRKTGTK